MRLRATIHVGGNLRAAAGNWLLYAAVRRALALGGWPPRILGPTFPAPLADKDGRGCARSDHQLGQQCCPMRNMADSGHQHKGDDIATTARRVLTATFTPHPSPMFCADKWTTGNAATQWGGRNVSCG